jgi:hypothetical protein
MIKRLGWLLALVMMCGVCCQSQNAEDAEKVTAGVYGSGGKVNGGGMSLSFYNAGPFWRVLNPGANFELGLFGPTPKTRADGVFSIDYQSTYQLHRGADRLYKPGLLYLSCGYSGFFTNGNGVNYGGGVTWRLPRPKAQYSTVSLEYREYYVPGWGRQPGFRLSYGVGGSE